MAFSTHIAAASARGADPTKVAGPLSGSAPVRAGPKSELDGKMPAEPDGRRLPGALQKLEMDAIEDEEVALIERLGTAWIAGTVPNQPIRMRPEDLSRSLGEGALILSWPRRAGSRW